MQLHETMHQETSPTAVLRYGVIVRGVMLRLVEMNVNVNAIPARLRLVEMNAIPAILFHAETIVSASVNALHRVEVIETANVNAPLLDPTTPAESVIIGMLASMPTCLETGKQRSL